MTTQQQSLTERFPGRRMPRIAMLVARFPKVTETFQLREMVAFEALGVPLELYAITHHDDGGTVQEEARDFDRRANYFARVSLEMLKAQFVWLRRNRAGYLKAWKWSLSAHKTAPEMFVRSFLVVPLAATMALRMEKQGIEHVHAHFATYPTQAALIIKWLTGLPFSFTGHAHDIQHRQEGLEAKIDECEFFVTCTQHSHDTLRELYGDKVTRKCHVVHHGVNLDAFSYREPPPDDGERPFRLVCVATFETCKGHHYLVEAVRILRDRGVDVELKLIGGDPPRKSTTQAEIRAQVRDAKLEDRVEFLGKQSLAEVRAALEWADIGVLASHRTAKGDMDGLPNVLTEALGMGRPVVSTTLPGIKELVDDGENGLLVRTRDAVAFADAIERLRNDSELRITMGKAGAEKVVATENVLDRTSELIGIYMDRIGRPA